MPTTEISQGARMGARLLQTAFKLLSGVPKELSALAPEIGAPAEISVPTRSGPVRCLVYRPQPPRPDSQGAPPPVYVHFHGGAFIVRHPEQDNHVCRYLAQSTGAAVISVDYATAPDVQYPVAEHQAYDVTAWAHQHGGEYGWDPNRLAVGGLSAGSKLAVNACQQARDSGLFMPTGLISGYGATDMTLSPGQRTSPSKHPAVAPWLIKLMYSTYFADPATRTSTLASPTRDSDLGLFPPTLIMTGDTDSMAAESVRFADQLSAAGVAVTRHTFPDTDHGFTHNKPVSTARKALDLIAQHLVQAFTTKRPL